MTETRTTPQEIGERESAKRQAEWRASLHQRANWSLAETLCLIALKGDEAAAAKYADALSHIHSHINATALVRGRVLDAIIDQTLKIEIARAVEEARAEATRKGLDEEGVRAAAKDATACARKVAEEAGTVRLRPLEALRAALEAGAVVAVGIAPDEAEVRALPASLWSRLKLSDGDEPAGERPTVMARLPNGALWRTIEFDRVSVVRAFEWATPAPEQAPTPSEGSKPPGPIKVATADQLRAWLQPIYDKHGPAAVPTTEAVRTAAEGRRWNKKSAMKDYKAVAKAIGFQMRTPGRPPT